MKKVIRILIFILIASFVLPQSNVICQNKISEIEHASKNSTRNRDLYASINTGIFEWISIGVGYQISKEFSIEFKHANTWLSGHGGNFIIPPYGSGVGTEIKYFSGNGIFNNISLTYIYLLYAPNIYDDSYGLRPKGNCFEINIGDEEIRLETGSRFNFFWSVGVGISTNKAYQKTLIMPSLKIGVTCNLRLSSQSHPTTTR